MVPREFWIEKFSDAFEEAGHDLSELGVRKSKSRSGAKSEWRILEGQLIRYMQCVSCLQWKERTSDNFKAEVGDEGKVRWFTDSIAGYECFANSQSCPCNVCFSEKTWIWSITHRYTGLHPPKNSSYSDTPIGWFKYKWDNFDFCSVTGLPKSFFELGPNRKNGISVNSIVLDKFQGRKYSQKNHKPETTELCAVFANVIQGETVPLLDWSPLYENLINLIQSNDEFERFEEETMIETARENWSSNPQENGVTTIPKIDKTLYQKQLLECHLPQILIHMVNGHLIADRNSKRHNPHTKPELKKIYFDLLIEQGFRCATSKMMMTIEKGPYRFSFDRIDNNFGHISGNIQVVCRILNPGHGGNMNLKRFLHIFLSQVVVDVPNDVRDLVSNWYDEL